jgi:VanZ family protein
LTTPPAPLALSRLIGLLALVYPCLLLYGSLYPLSGWTASGIPPLIFLKAPFPRYWTALDLAANLALYLPLGFLWALFMLGRPRLQKIWLVAVLPALFLSLGVEIVQNWLPSRVASNVDLACNALGAAAGVLLARWRGRQWLGALDARCASEFRLQSGGDVGLLLLMMWLVGQCVPEGTAFVLGDWRALWTGWPPEWAPRFGNAAKRQLEAAAVACFLIAVGLMLRELLRHAGWSGLSRLALLLAAAATARALSAGAMVRFPAAFDWLTPGAQEGIVIGIALLLPAYHLPTRLRRVLGPTAIVLGSLAINLTAPDPYANPLVAPAAGRALANLAGLTEFIAALWPISAVVWWLSRRRVE